MTVSESNVDDTASDNKRRAPLLKTITVLTLLLIAAIAGAFAMVSELEDRFTIGADVVMVFSIFASAAMLLLWVVWVLACSGLRWRNRIAIAIALVGLPIGFLKLFRPVHSGDVTIVGFRPVWSSPEELPDAADDKPTVDLVTETPDDFARFLGPNQDGSLDSGRMIDVDRFEESTILWKQPIGQGWSAFVARNGYAVTMEQRGTQECVTCYDVSTGQLQWIRDHRARHQDLMNLGRTGPRSTPTIADGYVYAVGAVGNFVCLNGSDGSVAWQVDLNELLGITLSTSVDSDGFEVQYEGNSTLNWGRSGAPLIVADLVVIPGGGPKGGSISTLLAFERGSGKLAWRGGTEMIAYGSPVLATVAGVEQILMTGESKTVSISPVDGAVLWEFERSGHSDADANTSQVTPVDENTVLVSKGYDDGGGTLLKINNSDGRLQAGQLWSSARVLKTKLTSPVLYQDHSYSLCNGFLECARLSDGERIWKRRGRFGHGQLLRVGGHLLVHSESGMLYLVNATPTGYEELGAVKTIDGVCWNTLCLYGDKLLVRSEIQAACIQLPVTKAE